MQKVINRPLQAPRVLIHREDMRVEDRPRTHGSAEGFIHQPVMVSETLAYLAVGPGKVFVDCTVGEGGHSLAILQTAMPGGQLLGIDLDPQALSRACLRLQQYGDSFTLTNGSYARLGDLASTLGFPHPDGILLDLGLSSLQLQTAGRGFSIQRDEPLDMRFDPAARLSAADIVNGYPMRELAEVLARFGEEPRARSIARRIAERRPLRSTRQLADLVAEVYGGRRGKTHPATRTFQALRIAVNGELDNLKAGLEQAISILKPGGRLVVISYHSLEDRIVKETIAREARGCVCPPRVPICTCGHTASLKVITKKVVTPSLDEVRSNPRSRSARMRVAESLQGNN